MSSDNPLATQVGGSHYAKLKVQPMEFSMANGWDACAHTILKYLTRYPDKNGIEDLRKAEHTAQLRWTLIWKNASFPLDLMPIEDYCLANGLSERQTETLKLLEKVVEDNTARAHEMLLEAIRALIGELEDERMDIIVRNGPTAEHYSVLYGDDDT